ncbi:MAG: Lrp/AsnC family transcriptional regulator [Hyphomicrobiaceae bacterium]
MASDFYKLDRIDIKILTELQKNARLSNVNLAESVGLSPSPCLQRVKKLEKAGYIESYNARLSIGRLAKHVLVFTEVKLHNHRREDFVKFETEIRKYDSILECHLVGGGFDYLLKFVTRNIGHYQEVIEDILERQIGVRNYFSYVVIKSVIAKDDVAIDVILPEGES